MPNLPLIETTGSPFDMGHQHGRQAAAKIHGAYRRFCPRPASESPERAELAGLMEHTVARRHPAALDEMHGIAAGSGLTFEQVRDLNFSVELWSEAWMGSASARGCTLAAVRSPAEGWLVGKTMDVTPGDDEFVLIHRARPAEGHAFIHVTYAGTVWTDGGVNERGLAQSNSALETCARDLQGYPVFLMARDLLQNSATVSEAVQMAAESGAVNFGSNILLADAEGEAAVVERSATGHAVRWAAPGAQVLFATNHSQTPAMKALLGGTPELLANSRARFERVDGQPPEPSLAGLQALFRDHSRPGGICQHGAAGLQTIASFIAATGPRQVWAVAGSPCEGAYEPVPL